MRSKTRLVIFMNFYTTYILTAPHKTTVLFLCSYIIYSYLFRHSPSYYFHNNSSRRELRVQMKEVNERICISLQTVCASIPNLAVC